MAGVPNAEIICRTMVHILQLRDFSTRQTGGSEPNELADLVSEELNRNRTLSSGVGDRLRADFLILI